MHRVLSFASLSLFCLTCEAQVGSMPSTVPPVFALRGATVFAGDGTVIQNAIVVINDGLIEAVGTDVRVPPGAWEIDLRGKFVYPGLFDCLTGVGLKRQAGRSGTVPGQEGESTGPPAVPDGGMLAHIRAADLLDAESKDFEAWRNAGILTLQLAPDQGIFMGQTAVINLNGRDRALMIVEPAAAARVSFGTLGFSSYPGSLMGTIAVLRQTLLDARQHAEATRIYENHPQGLKRPGRDRVLEALQPVIEGKTPLLFTAQTEREIRRSLSLAAEHKTTCIIAGGLEADRVADGLKQMRTPVLLSLNFPQKEKEGNPEAEESLETLLRRHHAPFTAARLHAAGVRFAFCSDGVKTPAEYVKNLRLAVKKGLPKEAALRAATLSAAEILGVDRQLGSIEPGKIANLIVTDQELFDDKSRVTSVFVDGEIFETPAVADQRADQKKAEDVSPDPAGDKSDQEIAFSYRAAPGAKEKLIKNATVMTVSQGTLQGVSVLVRDGKIAAIGKDLQAGPGADIIDATGKWLTPGIVDCHNHIASDSTNEGSVAVSSMTAIEDVLDPTDIAIYRDLAGGVTTAHTLHGSANPIGGKNSVIKLKWGKPAEELLFKAGTPGLKFALGENPKRSGASSYSANRRYPASRMGVEDVIRSSFLEAREYARKWDEYEQKKAAGVTPLLPPRRDLKLEPLVEILKGQRLMHVHAYRADEMLMTLRLADELGIKVATFDHGLEGYKIAKEIAAHGTGVTTFSDWWAYKAEAYDAIPYNAALLVRNGVLVSVNSDGAEESRHLFQEAAKCMKYGGLTENEALALVTLNPAKQLQIDKRVGSIDVGKDADLVIFNGYPLSVYAVPEMVFIDGDLYFSRDADRERQKQLEEIKKQLIAREKSAPRKPGEDKEQRSSRQTLPTNEEVSR